MALFFRAIESPDGRWECRQGRLVFDQHANVEEALDHLRSLARDTHEAFELFAHSRDGQIIRHEDGG